MQTLALDSLRTTVRGSIVTPSDTAFDTHRGLWNGMIDKRPAVIFRCLGAADVIAAVNTARDAGLQLAICGGGHSFPGFSTCDDGVMIDLSHMKSVSVDPAARVARAAGGLVWSDLDLATQRHGLATTGGTSSTVSVRKTCRSRAGAHSPASHLASADSARTTGPSTAWRNRPKAARRRRSATRV